VGLFEEALQGCHFGAELVWTGGERGREFVVVVVLVVGAISGVVLRVVICVVVAVVVVCGIGIVITFSVGSSDWHGWLRRAWWP